MTTLMTIPKTGYPAMDAAWSRDGKKTRDVVFSEQQSPLFAKRRWNRPG